MRRGRRSNSCLFWETKEIIIFVFVFDVLKIGLIVLAKLLFYVHQCYGDRLLKELLIRYSGKKKQQVIRTTRHGTGIIQLMQQSIYRHNIIT